MIRSLSGYPKILKSLACGPHGRRGAVVIHLPAGSQSVQVIARTLIRALCQLSAASARHSPGEVREGQGDLLAHHLMRAPSRAPAHASAVAICRPSPAVSNLPSARRSILTSPARITLEDTFSDKIHERRQSCSTQTPMARQSCRSHGPHGHPGEAWAWPHQNRYGHFIRGPYRARLASLPAVREYAERCRAERITPQTRLVD